MPDLILQGDILKVEGIGFPVLTVSKDFFNQTGKVIVCPIIENANASPLHFKLSLNKKDGFILCEQLRYLDLSIRHFKKIASLSPMERMEIADTVQCIFDYV